MKAEATTSKRVKKAARVDLKAGSAAGPPATSRRPIEAGAGSFVRVPRSAASRFAFPFVLRAAFEGSRAEVPPDPEAAAEKDLRQFRAIVERARADESDEVLQNCSHGRAAILIENLFKAGKKHVKILCSTLNPEVYGKPEIIAAAAAFLENPVARLDILVRDASALSKDNAFFVAFRDHPRVTMNLVLLPENSPNDFMVVDDSGVRLEGDAAKALDGDAAAQGSFNWPTMAAELKKLFAVYQRPLASA